MDGSPAILADRDDATRHSNVIEGVLLDLAAERATGCLQVGHPTGDEALVFLQDGLVYAAFVPGPRPLLGARLISSGVIDADSLARALEVQRSELLGWRLGELLVHLGYVDFHVIEDFTREQLRDMLADLFGWPVAIWQFLSNKRTRQGVGAPVEVCALVAAVRAVGCQADADAQLTPDLQPTDPPSRMVPFEVAALLREFSTIDCPRVAGIEAEEPAKGTTEPAPVELPKGGRLTEVVDRCIVLENTDTVALLRELSLLHDEPAPEPAPRPARFTGRGRAADKKRRRWLFAS